MKGRGGDGSRGGIGKVRGKQETAVSSLQRLHI